MKNKVYKIQTPFRDKKGEIETKKFNSPDEFWAYFFDRSDGSNSASLFFDFCLCGCWNWLMDDQFAQEWEELSERYTAAKELRIPPVKGDYDSAPSRLLENLLQFSAELNRAQIQKMKDEKNNVS